MAKQKRITIKRGYFYCIETIKMISGHEKDSIPISGPKVKLDDSEERDPTFILPEEGIRDKKLTFQLTVIDSKGLRSNDSCNVVLQNY